MERIIRLVVLNEVHDLLNEALKDICKTDRRAKERIEAAKILLTAFEMELDKR